MSKLEKLLEAMEPKGCAYAIRHAFDCMDIAEEVLKGRDRPGLFLHLCPTDPLIGKADWLYRAHATELVNRAERGEDLRPGTDAECLGALMAVATKAPLQTDAAAAVETLWARIAPKWSPRSGEPVRESYPGAAEERIAEARRHVRVETRRLP